MVGESVDEGDDAGGVGEDAVPVLEGEIGGDEQRASLFVARIDDLVEQIGGVIVIEALFGLPGLGRLTVEAVLSRDFPTIQAVILLFSVVYVLINLLIDISYTLFDPRIRY